MYACKCTYTHIINYTLPLSPHASTEMGWEIVGYYHNTGANEPKRHGQGKGVSDVYMDPMFHIYFAVFVKKKDKIISTFVLLSCLP